MPITASTRRAVHHLAKPLDRAAAELPRGLATRATEALPETHAGTRQDERGVVGCGSRPPISSRKTVC